MLIIIPITGNPETMTYKVAKVYQSLLKDKGLIAPIFSLEEVPRNFTEIAFSGIRNSFFDNICNEKITPEEQIVVITPEYNGSIPGIFKTFLDVCDLSVFRGKKAALVGVASGRAGNLRGMDHLTDIFHNMGVEVLSYKVPISRINEEIDESGNFINKGTVEALKKQIDLFLAF